MKRLLSASSLPSLAFAVALIVAWQFVAESRIVSPVFFPAPSLAFEVLGVRFADG